jgi:hypothetical protein
MHQPRGQDLFGNNDIPQFNKNGGLLTQKERLAIAQRRGLCVQCGMRTHTVSIFQNSAITNDDVYKGICIKCNPTLVPANVLQGYDHRNPRVTAPVVHRPSRNTIPTAVPTGMLSAAHRARNRVATRSESEPTNNPIRSSATSAEFLALPPTRTSTGTTVNTRTLQNRISNEPRDTKHTLRGVVGAPLLDDPNHRSASSFDDAISISNGTTRANSRGNNAEDYRGGVVHPDNFDVDTLLDSLKDDRGDPELLKQTLHRIRNFGYDQDPIAIMHEIRDLMDQYVNDSRVMAMACGALWRLAAGENSRKIEAADGTIESIVDALRKEKNKDDADFVQWAFGCLASLAEAQDVKLLIAKIGGIEAIVDGLNRHQASSGVFEWAARALHNLCYQLSSDHDISDVVTKNIVSVEETKGITALVGAMKLPSHVSEVTAQRWVMGLLWILQDQEADEANARVLKKMKDDGFIKVAVKILRRAVESETDLFHLSAELMCNILVSDRSDAAFRDASDCLTTIVRSLKADAEDNVKNSVKQESCCRIVATLMNGTDYSRMLVYEANGVQAVLGAIDKSPDNYMLTQTGIWAVWSMSSDERNREDEFLIKAAQSLVESLEQQVETFPDLLLPVCGFYGNMCLIPGMNAVDVPIASIVRALLTEEDALILDESERAVANFCIGFPDEVDHLVDAFDMDHLLQILQSGSDLNPTLCRVLASVASNSDRARGRMASPDVITWVLEKLRDPSDHVMTKAYLELLTTLVISGNHKSTRVPDDIVQVVLRLIMTTGNRDNIQWTCCALLRNLLISTASPPDLTGMMDSMIALVDGHGTPEILKMQACGVIWSLTAKYTNQDSNSLLQMSQCVVRILTRYKGDQGPFDYDLLSMAAGALAAITSCMLHNPVHISSEDVDEIISVPYTALDFESDRTELYVRILDSVYNLSFVCDAVLIQCGVIVVVIDTMAEFELCLEIQQFGCAILAVLASTENLQVNLSIVQTDGIDMIVNALALFSDDGVVQNQACKALSHLSIDEESRMLIASLGGLMLLGNTMRANLDKLDLLEGALSAILSLSADADVELLTESNIVAIVVAAMRQHRAVSQIQEFGMGVLQNISMRCFESKQAIAEAGGIIAVTDCIKEFMGSPTVLERAFTTLWSLAVLDQNQGLIAEADGINLVVNGMMTAISYESVQKQGCGCLCTLSSDSRNKGLIQNVGGVDSIVFAMWAHYAAEEIQVEACRALSSLAVDAQTNEVMIASDGEVNAIISAMRRFPVSERLQEHACVALRNFLLSADNVDIIKSNEHELRTLVQQAASRFPEACQERANQVLASLG